MPLLEDSLQNFIADNLEARRKYLRNHAAGILQMCCEYTPDTLRVLPRNLEVPLGHQNKGKNCKNELDVAKNQLFSDPTWMALQYPLDRGESGRG